jgi:DNA polymerase-3 subunit delta'
MKLHPAYLWIGPEEALKTRAISFVQQHLCAQGGCGSCYTCKGIVERQHHALTWLEPENYYTVNQLQELFAKICFALEAQQKYFIIIERADLFTSASANSLLKSLEEPFEGYHYILLAPTEVILPTIRSRCVVEHFSVEEPVTHRLVEYFTNYHFSRADELMNELQKDRIREKEVDQLLDAIMHHWHQVRKQAIIERDTQKEAQSMEVISLIEAARTRPPMPGSAKVFLKNIFLNLNVVLDT